ncbi:minus strand repeat motif-containing protein (plasmid) [Borreliella garinii Far04]|nr:minus strand repeat motif-containing protein [Borreliella garinii Far04]
MYYKYLVNNAWKIGPKIAAINSIKCIGLFPVLRSLRKSFASFSILLVSSLLTLSILVSKLSILMVKFFSAKSILAFKAFYTLSILVFKLDISFCKLFSITSILASKLDISFRKFFSASIIFSFKNSKL